MYFRFLLLFIPLNALAILPLPYPVDGLDEEQPLFEIPPPDPTSILGYSELHLGGKLREMELPFFGSQDNVPGYAAVNGFQVPASLKERVGFWKKIYSEFTSDQALLHDAQYPELIYEVLDISSIRKNSNLSYRRQLKLISQLIKERKKELSQKLVAIEEEKNNPSALPLDQFILFKKFETINEENKYKKAANRIRVQIGQRDRIVKGFFYGGRYFKRMMEIFEEMGLPKELTRLPLVESAFNIRARSKVGASGVWQFMRSTGKLFLHIDKSVDERNDPLVATYAAAQLLRQNFEALGSWPLAITAYNHGREGMVRAVRMVGTKDLATLINKYQSNTFGFASSNFYSEFLAILEVEREYRKHFGKLMVDSPLQFEELTIPVEEKLSNWLAKCEIEKSLLMEMNPSLTDYVSSGRNPIPKGFKLKVPLRSTKKCTGDPVSITDNKYDRKRTRSISQERF